MGKHPDGVPSLEELGEDTPLPNYWLESTTITVDRYVKERLDAHRDGRPWNEYLEKLRREHADPITLNDAEAIAEYVAGQVDGADPEEIADAVAKRLDYAEVANKTAQNVVRELR